VSALVVCSVGTTDPWNAAGLGLDLRALAALGARGVSVVAAVSAQDENGLHALHAVPAETIAAQFAALARAPIAAYRIGALPDASSVALVAAALAAAGVPAVYDPVFAPSAGGTFSDARTIAAVRELLLPRVTVVTPNLSEAAMLLARPPAATVAAMRVAAADLRAFGPGAALLTGGHLSGDPVDVLADDDGIAEFADKRLPGTMRGTGCLLAVALAVELARSTPLRAAVIAARAFVRERFARAVTLGPMSVSE
jgi:hydroxymethylpyrimidine/phosphomethylpyrimidine kinase